MTMLEALATYLCSNGVATALGTDVFIDFLPEEPAEVVVLAEYAGFPTSQFDTILQRSVQIRTRAATSDAARSKAVAIFSLLKQLPEDRRVDLTQDIWAQIYVRQTPFKLSQDTSDRISYVFNIGVTTNIIE